MNYVESSDSNTCMEYNIASATLSLNKPQQQRTYYIELYRNYSVGSSQRFRSNSGVHHAVLPPSTHRTRLVSPPATGHASNKRGLSVRQHA